MVTSDSRNSLVECHADKILSGVFLEPLKVFGIWSEH